MPWPPLSVSSALERRARAGAQEGTRFQGRREPSECNVGTGSSPGPGTERYMRGLPSGPTDTPGLLEASWGPGISWKHSTFQVGGRLCGSQAVVRPAGAEDRGGSLCCDFKSPGLVSPRVLDGWRREGGNQGWAGQACGRGFGCLARPPGVGTACPSGLRLEPWATGSGQLVLQGRSGLRGSLGCLLTAQPWPRLPGPPACK